jgi:hypothetical protein
MAKYFFWILWRLVGVSPRSADKSLAPLELSHETHYKIAIQGRCLEVELCEFSKEYGDFLGL